MPSPAPVVGCSDSAGPVPRWRGFESDPVVGDPLEFLALSHRDGLRDDRHDLERFVSNGRQLVPWGPSPVVLFPEEDVFSFLILVRRSTQLRIVVALVALLSLP